MNEETVSSTRRTFRKVAVGEVPVNKHRGGEIRTLLSPANVGATSGFMGLAKLEPGEFISEHYHPYSEEFVFLLSGRITLRLDGEELELGPREGILVPINVRHRLDNNGDEPAELLFQLGPLAPRPDLGHVDTEDLPFPELAPAGEPR